MSDTTGMTGGTGVTGVYVMGDMSDIAVMTDTYVKNDTGGRVDKVD